MTIRQPEVTASLRPAGVTAGLTPEKLLIVGQRNGGTSQNGELQRNILNDGAEDGLFGPDAIITAAIRRARARNPETQIDAIGLDDAGGATNATGVITFNGTTASAAGTFKVTIGSKKDNTYTVPVVIGADPTAVGDALAAAITADTRSLVTAVPALGAVTVTAKNGGTVGNTIGIKIEGSVPGLGSLNSAMSGGSVDPTLTGVFDVIGNERYQGIVWQFSGNTTPLTDLLDPRFNTTNNVLDGRGFVGITDTLANILFYLGPLNSQSLSVTCDQLINELSHVGPAVMDLPFVKATEFAAIRALRRTQDAVLGGLVLSRSAQDSFGGPWQNSKPYFNTPFPGLLVPDSGDSFTDVEIEQILDAGGWVIDANSAFTAVIAGEVVTTYKTDAAGNPDPTYKFLNYVDTATAAREYIVNNTRSQFPQYRATSGSLISGVDSANEASVAAYVSELYDQLGDLGLVNTGIGSIDGETVDFDKQFREALTVSLNPVTGRFLISAKLFIVVQFRAAVYDLAIAFEV